MKSLIILLFITGASLVLAFGEEPETIWVNNGSRVERLPGKYATPKNILKIKKLKEGDTIYIGSFTRYEQVDLLNNKEIFVDVYLKKEKMKIIYFEVVVSSVEKNELVSGILFLLPLSLVAFLFGMYVLSEVELSRKKERLS